MQQYYSFNIAKDKILKYNGIVPEPGSGFHLYTDKSFGLEDIYHKTVDGKITKIICYAMTEQSAKAAVKEYLDNL